MNYNAVDLGKRVREIRVRMNLSQAIFAEKLGVNREHITKIENGNKNPSIDLLIDMAELSCVSLDYLILGHRESSDLRIRIQSIADELVELAQSL